MRLSTDRIQIRMAGRERKDFDERLERQLRSLVEAFVLAYGQEGLRWKMTFNGSQDGPIPGTYWVVINLVWSFSTVVDGRLDWVASRQVRSFESDLEVLKNEVIKLIRKIYGDESLGILTTGPFSVVQQGMKPTDIAREVVFEWYDSTYEEEDELI